MITHVPWCRIATVSRSWGLVGSPGSIHCVLINGIHHCHQCASVANSHVTIRAVWHGSSSPAYGSVLYCCCWKIKNKQQSRLPQRVTQLYLPNLMMPINCGRYWQSEGDVKMISRQDVHQISIIFAGVWWCLGVAAVSFRWVGKTVRPFSSAFRCGVSTEV